METFHIISCSVFLIKKCLFRLYKSGCCVTFVSDNWEEQLQKLLIATVSEKYREFFSSVTPWAFKVSVWKVCISCPVRPHTNMRRHSGHKTAHTEDPSPLVNKAGLLLKKAVISVTLQQVFLVILFLKVVFCTKKIPYTPPWKTVTTGLVTSYFFNVMRQIETVTKIKESRNCLSTQPSKKAGRLFCPTCHCSVCFGSTQIYKPCLC